MLLDEFHPNSKVGRSFPHAHSTLAILEFHVADGAFRCYCKLARSHQSIAKSVLRTKAG